jgi:hypothetical protein
MHWWVAPFYPQAEIAYTRIRAGLDTATGPKVYTSNDTKLTIKLHINDAVMWFKSGEKPDGLYGEDVYSAVIDEATRVRELLCISTDGRLWRSPKGGQPKERR